VFAIQIIAVAILRYNWEEAMGNNAFYRTFKKKINLFAV
jgi:hypothetical protein